MLLAGLIPTGKKKPTEQKANFETNLGTRKGHLNVF